MPPALTPEQEAVVRADAPALQVAAGAGTGKTTTLAHRVARLVREGATPQRILVVTFTREATASLARRISLLLGRDHGVEVRSFHSFAARELGGAGLRYLEAGDQRRLAQRAAGPLLQAFPASGRAGDDPVERFLAFVSYCKNRETTAGVAIRERFQGLARHADAAADALAAYVDGQEGALDFDDLLVAFRDRLRGDAAFRARTQGRLDHLLVDEYQDVNRVQHDVVLLLARPTREGGAAPSVVAVGDERQAIYGFRGGDPDLLAAFSKSLDGGERLALTTNFRSASPILERANRLFPSHDALVPASPDRVGPLPRALAFPTPEAEAAFVFDDAWRLVDAGHDAAEIAILYRSRHLADALESALRNGLAAARKAAGRVGSRHAGRAEVDKWEQLATVTRSTIHAAKGLEWDHVYLVGAREGGIPSIPERVPKGYAPSAEDKAVLLAEERRLFYVAATRPRQTFTVTWPERDRSRAQNASRFLAEYFATNAAPSPADVRARPATA